MKIFFVSLLVLAACYSAFSQSTTNSAGGEASGNGEVTYSVGIPVYTTQETQGGSSSQGVQHAIEVLNVGVANQSESSSSIRIFPNPTTEKVTLSILNDDNVGFSFQLIDLQGKVLEQRKMQSPIEDVKLNDLPSGTYMLLIFKENNTIDQFKLIKQ